MKITVCELPDRRRSFATAWQDLVDHVRSMNSELVVLPDMPFSSWFAHAERFDRNVWAAAVRDHDEWEHRLRDLSPAIVMASRPVDFGNECYDEGFIWEDPVGTLSVHATSFPPDAAAVREGSWHDSAPADFTPLEVHGLRIAMLIGDEMWAPGGYDARTVDVLGVPRAGDAPAHGDCLQRACALADLSRAYLVSSNRSGDFGGGAWIISPEGEVLGTTSQDEPFLSMDIALRPIKGEPRYFDMFSQ